MDSAVNVINCFCAQSVAHRQSDCANFHVISVCTLKHHQWAVLEPSLLTWPLFLFAHFLLLGCTYACTWRITKWVHNFMLFPGNIVIKWVHDLLFPRIREIMKKGWRSCTWKRHGLVMQKTILEEKKIMWMMSNWILWNSSNCQFRLFSSKPVNTALCLENMQKCKGKLSVCH